MATDYYEVLGVARDADEGTIKRAYRQLARKYHPDVADDKVAAENHFKEINEAYEVLSDATKRANYDRFGHAGVNGAGGMGEGFNPFGSEGFGDIFDMFFGAARAGAAGAQQRRNGPARGSDLRYDVEISLEEAYHGTTRDISFRNLATCGTCRGSGAEPGTLVVPCDRCGGSGMQRQVRQTPLGQFVTQTTCSRCSGDGQVVQTPCTTCRGRGRVEQERALHVKIHRASTTGRASRSPAAAKPARAAAPTAICTCISRSRRTPCSSATGSTC
jgi:molecular chaperone DnaJ